MTDAKLTKLVEAVEERSNGWVHGGDVPRCNVYADGKRIDNVRSVHRKTGRAVVYVTDEEGVIQIHKHGKRLLTKTLYFNHIELIRVKG